MSEYWVSKKKYFCKYCDVYIADDVPSRSHHENGMRHKGNKERFVKGLYKAGEKRKKDLEEEAREMKNIDAAAARAYALDVGSGRAGPSSGPPPVTAKPAIPPPKKPTNPYTNYTTAEFLGYKDLDVERVQAELEYKRTQGVAGNWELIPSTTQSPAPLSISAPGAEGDEKPPTTTAEMVLAGTKRDAETPAAEADDEDGRAWKLRKKTARLGDIYDPGIIPIKIKPKVDLGPKIEDEAEVNTGAVRGSDGNEGSQATALPKWTKIKWRRAAGPGDSAPVSTSLPSLAGGTLPVSEPISAKAEPEIASSPHLPSEVDSGALPLSQPYKTETHSSPDDRPKLEDSPSEVPSATGSLFKKRKAPVGGAARGRRAQF